MGIFDNLKSIGKVLQKAGKIEQYKQILETQRELLEMQNKIQDFNGENAELRKKLKIKDALIYENNTYWIKKEDKKDGPFCSCCWDSEQKLIRMHPCNNPAFHNCPGCKTKVQTNPGYRPPFISRKSAIDSYI